MVQSAAIMPNHQEFMRGLSHLSSVAVRRATELAIKVETVAAGKLSGTELRIGELPVTKLVLTNTPTDLDRYVPSTKGDAFFRRPGPRLVRIKKDLMHTEGEITQTTNTQFHLIYEKYTTDEPLSDAQRRELEAQYPLRSALSPTSFRVRRSLAPGGDTNPHVANVLTIGMEFGWNQEGGSRLTQATLTWENRQGNGYNPQSNKIETREEQLGKLFGYSWDRPLPDSNGIAASATFRTIGEFLGRSTLGRCFGQIFSNAFDNHSQESGIILICSPKSLTVTDLPLKLQRWSYNRESGVFAPDNIPVADYIQILTLAVGLMPTDRQNG